MKVQLIGEFDFTREELMSRDYAKSIMTDCWMVIEIDEKKYFDDWICPLECYFQLTDWKKGVLSGTIIDFHYISDDNDENPIFSFIFSSGLWKIESIFSQYNENNLFNTDCILDFLESFEKQLLEHIKK